MSWTFLVESPTGTAEGSLVHSLISEQRTSNYKAALGHDDIGLGSHSLHLEAVKQQLFAWTPLTAATAQLAQVS